MKKRTIFIWDIHGCYTEFSLLVKKLEIQNHDSVYILGDMINKGPESFQVLEYIYKQLNFTAILWNHEVNFLLYKQGRRTPVSKASRNCWATLIKKLKDFPEIEKWLENLPLFIEKNNFICFHWGKMPNKALKTHSAEEITNLRLLDDNIPWYKKYNNNKMAIYWHWAVEGLQIRKNTIGLDSGCAYGWCLSAYILESWEVIQQKSLQAYTKTLQKHNTPNFFSNIKILINKITWK